MRRVYCTIFFLLLCAGAARGQFSIESNAPSTVLDYVADSVRKISAKQFEYISRAKEEDERRRLRNQRNTLEFNATLQAAQNQFENWAAGGQNTTSARSTIFFRYQYTKAPFSLDTKFESRYGMNFIDKTFFKNEDEFKLNFMALRNIARNWSYAGSVNLRSQWANGFPNRNNKTRISSFMSPGYTDAAVGINYRTEKQTLSATFNPFGWNLTTVIDPQLSAQGLYGVPAGERFRGYIGPSLRVDIDKEFAKKVLRLRSYFYTFASFTSTPMVRWENTLDIRANKYLTTTLFGVIYYDKLSSAPHPSKMQFNSSISVGVSYKFKNK